MGLLSSLATIKAAWIGDKEAKGTSLVMSCQRTMPKLELYEAKQSGVIMEEKGLKEGNVQLRSLALGLSAPISPVHISITTI